MYETKLLSDLKEFIYSFYIDVYSAFTITRDLAVKPQYPLYTHSDPPSNPWSCPVVLVWHHSLQVGRKRFLFLLLRVFTLPQSRTYTHRTSTEDNTGHNTNTGHTPNPMTEIKIPDPDGNRTRAAGLKGRDSTNHAIATNRKMTPGELLTGLSRESHGRSYVASEWEVGQRRISPTLCPWNLWWKWIYYSARVKGIRKALSHQCKKNNAYVVHFFSGTIYSRGLKFLQVIYESFDCDLTDRFFDSWFQ